jgi:hypothetical protein
VVPSTPPPTDPREAFIEAAAAQLARATGAAADGATTALLRDHVATVLDAPDIDAAARHLLGEPALLAACFQNVDLLYLHAAPEADAVAARVMRALDLAARGG